MITVEVAKQQKHVKMLLDAGFDKKTELRFLDQELIMVFLVAEKHNPDSKYKHFIDTLPLTYENFPEHYTEDELQWVKGSELF